MSDDLFNGISLQPFFSDLPYLPLGVLDGHVLLMDNTTLPT